MFNLFVIKTIHFIAFGSKLYVDEFIGVRYLEIHEMRSL